MVQKELQEVTLENIKQRIEKAVPQSNSYVLDPMHDGNHLQAFVISPVFEGMPVFKQHQMIMTAIKDIFQVVHALDLKTFTPAQWEKEKAEYGF